MLEAYTQEIKPEGKRMGGVESAINSLNEALDDLTRQLTTLEQELHLVCRPCGPVCGADREQHESQSPVSEAIVLQIRRVNSLRDTVASIRNTLDL